MLREKGAENDGSFNKGGATRKRTKLCILLVLLGSLAMVPWASPAESLADKAEAMKKYLEAKGFSVLPGEYVKLDFTNLFCNGMADSCNGNNFGAPYLTAKVPPLEGQSPSFAPFTFRLRRNEAVVLVGPTPPPCDYYSYTTFLFNRYDGNWGPSKTRKIFSSFGDPLNRFVLKTGGSPFSKNIVLIYTPDENTDKAVRNAAKASGFKDAVVNTYIIPSALLVTNDDLDETTDQLVIGQRTALWADGSKDGGGYLENPGVVVLRVTPAKSAPSKAFSTPKQRVRGTGQTEFDLLPYVDNLRQAILDHYPGLNAQELATDRWIEQSPIALQTWANTLGDSSDAAYLHTKENFKLSNDPNDFLIVYGVNHEKTGKAIYANVNVYQSCFYCGIASVFSHCYNAPGDLSCVSFGTARDYLTSNLPKDPDQLYTLKISRNCGQGGTHCLQVPTSTNCGEGAGLNEELFLATRAYVEPETKTGPSLTELVFDRVLHFTAPPPTLEFVSNPLNVQYPASAEIKFKARSVSAGDIRWNAAIEYLDNDCCGTLEPLQGVLPAGNEETSVRFTPNRPGRFFILITVMDGADRTTTREIVVQSAP